ncbi:MAG: type II secretion system minor pseudopilin GspH [Pseudomonadota bacterium]
MPTSTTASLASRSRSVGWTLIELLVVVVIIGIVVSIALLSVGVVGDDRKLQQEARRFAALYELLQDEAALQGREYGIELMRGAYRFVEFDTINNVWIGIPFDDTLRTRRLPEDMELELYLEDKRVLLDDDPAELDDPDKLVQIGSSTRYEPHLLVFSSGDATPFEVHVWRDWDDARAIVVADALGTLEFQDVDE